VNTDRVLLTGAAGFVGSAIAMVLRNAGFRERVGRSARGATFIPTMSLPSDDLRDRGAVAAALTDTHLSTRLRTIGCGRPQR
jgi:nucleoside-diphosphate-sugar epimerase